MILKLLISSVSVLIAAYLLPSVHIDGYFVALVVAVVLGLLNTLLKPLLVLLTLPINILSLGLFTFIINALLVLLASSLIDGFYVDSLLSALLFSLITSLTASFLNHLT
jgi:putative membrane protein